MSKNAKSWKSEKWEIIFCENAKIFFPARTKNFPFFPKKCVFANFAKNPITLPWREIFRVAPIHSRKLKKFWVFFRRFQKCKKWNPREFRPFSGPKSRNFQVLGDKVIEVLKFRPKISENFRIFKNGKNWKNWKKLQKFTWFFAKKFYMIFTFFKNSKIHFFHFLQKCQKWTFSYGFNLGFQKWPFSEKTEKTGFRVAWIRVFAHVNYTKNRVFTQVHSTRFFPVLPSFFSFCPKWQVQNLPR